MEVSLQIISILISFLFGIFFYLFSRIHFSCVSKSCLFFKFITTFLFVFDSVLAYVILFYYVNEGIFHIYFLLSVVLGYFLALSLHKSVKLKNKFLTLLVKKKR